MLSTRFAITALVGFAFIFAYEFVVHGILLKSGYMATATLWRPEADMQKLFPFMLVIQFIMAVVLAWIYAQNHEGKGINEGLRYGSYIGLLLGVMSFGMYAYMPLPFDLALKMGAAALLEGILLGVVFSLVYKSKCASGCCCNKE